MKKKILSTLLALCMVLSLLPMAAMAEEGDVSATEPVTDPEVVSEDTSEVEPAAEPTSLTGDEFLAKAQNGTIKLDNDVTLTDAVKITSGTYTITADTAVNINVANVTDAFEVSGGTLTLGANITVSSNTSILWAHDGGKIIVDGAILTATNSPYVPAFAEGAGSCINVVSGSLISNGSTNVTLDINNSATAAISDGTISSNSSSAVCAQGGAVFTVNGGTVTTASSGMHSAAYSKNGGKIIVNDGTLTTPDNTSAALIAAKFDTATGGSVTVAGGTVEGVRAHEDENSTATITGGTITDTVSADDGASLTISGGTFSAEPDSKYIAADYYSVKSEENTYTVEKTPLKRAEEQWSKFSEQANWVRVQGLAYYYGLAQTYVNGLTEGDVKTTATARLATLTDNINDVTELNLAGVQIPDGYNKDLGALEFFPNLTSVDVSGVNATNFGALAQLSELETLNVSNTSMTDFGALANLTSLKNLTATGLNLTSVAALYNLVNTEGFKADGTWDLSGSKCTVAERVENENTYLIDAIQSKFATDGGTFKAPDVNFVYTITFDANGGTISDPTATTAPTTTTATTEYGKLTTLPTATLSSYTFNGWYTAASGGTKVTTDTVFTGDTTVYAQWTYNAPYYPSTGGGSSSGSSSSSGTTSTTTKNEDGSTTTTTTDKSTGTVTETTKNTDGSTSVVETAKDGTVTETVTTTDGVSGTVVTDAEGTVTEVTAEVPASADGESVTIPVEVAPATDAADAVEIEVSVSSKVDSVTVTIPVEDVTPGTVIVLVHEDGTEEVVPKTALTEDGLAIELDGSVTLKVVDNTKTFNDTEDHWADDAITFVTSRELFNGVGNDDFAPEQTMNRAMLATVLWRLEGKQEADVNGAFSDVESGTWYTDAINWAAESGIINGYGDSYGTNDPITREQMVTILYRLNGSPAVSGSVEGASDWAADAMAWAVEIGLLQGDSNGLNPQGTATRAQVSTILMRYMGL